MIFWSLWHLEYLSLIYYCIYSVVKFLAGRAQALDHLHNYILERQPHSF